MILYAGLFVAAVTVLPHFDVASVRPNRSGGDSSRIVRPDGISFVNVTLADCLAAAFSIEPHQVKGPDWLRRDRYNIVAKADTPTERVELMLMLQSLLTERFQLTFHREEGQLAVYVLKKSTGPLRLKPAESRDGVLPIRGGMTFQGMTMDEFTDEFLSRLPFFDGPVVNRTMLDGRFTFSLRIFEEAPAAGELKAAVAAGGPDLFINALQQVGLALMAEKISTEFIVVDDANRLPIDD